MLNLVLKYMLSNRHCSLMQAQCDVLFCDLKQTPFLSEPPPVKYLLISHHLCSKYESGGAMTLLWNSNQHLIAYFC